MPIVPVGSINLAAITVPNVYVQIVPPNPVLSGVPTDIIGIVGTATWGPVNSPVAGSFQNGVQLFGNPQTTTYDMMTNAYSASLQGASNFRFVRVTDGTDVAASGDLMDGALVPGVGAILTSIYTGVLGNTLNATVSLGSTYTPSVPTYKVSIYFNTGVPEVFDNIGGVGNAFWVNLVNAINNGQSSSRPPSQLVIATLGTGVSSVTVTDAGTLYTSLPTLGTTGPGSGAVLAPVMKATAATVASTGSGYTSGDTITLAGGTFTTATVITVDTVTGGAVDTYHISTPGAYTVLASNPLSQGSTSGSGVGATFDLTYGLNSVHVTSHGSGYDNTSVFTVTGGGGSNAAGTLLVGSVTAPSLSTIQLNGGTNGNTGVTSATLIGVDTVPRSGMYALRKTGASIAMLSDQTDSTKWPLEVAFALSEGLYQIGQIAPGYQDNISGAITLKQNEGISSYDFKLMQGDWCQIFDPFNNVNRYISPQGFVCGILATQLPNDSSLNKPMQGIISTQKSAENRQYDDSELLELQTAGIDVITQPIPLDPISNQFGVRLGINTSGNQLTYQDNYPRMVNFLGQTTINGMGFAIGQPQTTDLRLQVQNALQSLLQTLYTNNMIGDVNNPGNPMAAYQVICDATNNPPNQVALGFLQVNVKVSLFTIVQVLVVNLQAQQGITVNVLSPTTV